MYHMTFIQVNPFQYCVWRYMQQLCYRCKKRLLEIIFIQFGDVSKQNKLKHRNCISCLLSTLYLYVIGFVKVWFDLQSKQGENDLGNCFPRHLPALLSLSPAEYVSCLAVKCLNKFTKYSVPNIFVCKMIRHQTKKRYCNHVHVCCSTVMRWKPTPCSLWSAAHLFICYHFYQNILIIC